MSAIKITGMFFCFAVSLSLVSCSPGHQLSSTASSRQYRQSPRFLDDISLDGGGRNHIQTTSAATQRRKTIRTGNNELQSKYAGLLGIPAKAIANVPLYSFIEDWYGVKYCYGGSDKSGIDCSAFVQMLYEDVFSTNVLRTAVEQFSSCSLIQDISSLKEGDLVFFRTHGSRISHVGVYLANKFFVHASTSQGVTISSLDETYWKRYYAGAGSVPRSRT